MALPVLHMHTAQSGLDALPNSAPTVPTIKKIQSAFSNGTASLTEVAIAGRPRLAGDAAGDRRPEDRKVARARQLTTGSIDVEVNKAHTVARVDIPLVGKGTDGDVQRRARERSATTSCRRRSARSAARSTRVTGVTAASADSNALLKQQGSACVRLRARVRVPAPARHLPLGRDRGQGDRPQPAVRRRRLRRARRRLPVGLGREPARLHVERRHRRSGCRSSCS